MTPRVLIDISPTNKTFETNISQTFQHHCYAYESAFQKVQGFRSDNWQGRIQPVRHPKFENSKMLWNTAKWLHGYRLLMLEQVATKSIRPAVYRLDRLYSLDRQTVVHPRVARPWVIAPSQWPLRESGTLFRWPSRRCTHCPCSSDSSRLCCLPPATTVNATYCLRRNLVFWFVTARRYA